MRHCSKAEEMQKQKQSLCLAVETKLALPRTNWKLTQNFRCHAGNLDDSERMQSCDGNKDINISWMRTSQAGRQIWLVLFEFSYCATLFPAHCWTLIAWQVLIDASYSSNADNLVNQANHSNQHQKRKLRKWWFCQSGKISRKGGRSSRVV